MQGGYDGLLRDKSLGISASSVQRIWHAHGLQPHRVQQFTEKSKLGIDKLRDVVGLYVDPPAADEEGPRRQAPDDSSS